MGSAGRQWWRICLLMQETWVRSLDWEDPWRRKWQPTPVFLPGESKDRGAWRATVHGAAKSRTGLSSQEQSHTENYNTWKLRQLWVNTYQLYNVTSPHVVLVVCLPPFWVLLTPHNSPMSWGPHHLHWTEEDHKAEGIQGFAQHHTAYAAELRSKRKAVWPQVTCSILIQSED